MEENDYTRGDIYCNVGMSEDGKLRGRLCTSGLHLCVSVVCDCLRKGRHCVSNRNREQSFGCGRLYSIFIHTYSMLIR